MRAESTRGLPAETGGVLIGHRIDNEIVVTVATGPGPRARRTPSSFRRDGDYTQEEVDRQHEASGGRDDYVGEWHSHPDPVGPSTQDLASMRWISGNAQYVRAEPLLMILQRVNEDWRPLAYRWSAAGLRSARVLVDG